jgi:hypothetical protein
MPDQVRHDEFRNIGEVVRFGILNLIIGIYLGFVICFLEIGIFSLR